MMSDIKRGFNEHPYEIKTDNNTLWINRKFGCVARFSPVEAELRVRDRTKPMMRVMKPKQDAWKKFQALVLDCYGFELGNLWCPQWVTENAQ